MIILLSSIYLLNKNKMKKSFFLAGSVAIVATLSIISCSKQNNSTNNNSSTTSSTNSNGPTYIATLSLTPQGIPTGTNFSGTLFVLAKWTSGNQSINYSATANFFNIPPANPLLPTATNSVQIGSVYVNDSALMWSTSNSTYYGGKDLMGYTTWVISAGASSIPSFTHTCTQPFPGVGAYPGGITINRANGYSINGLVYGGYDMIEATISDASGHDTTISENGSPPTFSAGALSTLLPGTGYLNVTMYTYDGEAVSGKNFLFVTGTIASTQTVTLQ